MRVNEVAFGVDGEDRDTQRLGQAGEPIEGWRRGVGRRMQMQDQVHPPSGLERELPHSGLQQVRWIQQAGKIVEDVLGILIGSQTGHRETSGLGLGADNGEVLAHERVEQGGLADVRCAGKGDVAGSGGMKEV